MLRDRVEDFIANRADPEELHELLLECMNNGTVEGLACVRRLYEDMYGGFTFNFEIKSPSASCLVFWGEAGLKALVDGANATPASKNISLCVRILSTVASGQPISELSLIRDGRVAEKIWMKYGNLDGIDEIARVLLPQFVLSRESDDDVASLGTGLQVVDDMGAAKELFAAMSARWLAVGEPVLRGFERLILERPADEPAFQSFLTEYPQILDPLAIQVWPQPNLLGSRYPDFLVRRADNSYLVIEIECPAKSLVKGGQASAAVTHAEQQVTDYRDYLMRRHQDAIQHFPHFNDPDCLVVTGLQRELDENQMAVMTHVNRHRVRLRIVGFDWLVERARNIATNITRHRVQVIRARVA
ncbi:MAG: Shedu anti-phage system protein SduA domain-containing protein [Acetobacteraceae bacterium]